jgi:hypothetical protein
MMGHEMHFLMNASRACWTGTFYFILHSIRSWPRALTGFDTIHIVFGLLIAMQSQDAFSDLLPGKGTQSNVDGNASEFFVEDTVLPSASLGDAQRGTGANLSKPGSLPGTPMVRHTSAFLITIKPICSTPL